MTGSACVRLGATSAADRLTVIVKGASSRRRSRYCSAAGQVGTRCRPGRAPGRLAAAAMEAE